MPLMREIDSPLKKIGIHYYKDENGTYYRKIGGGHRKKIKKPFWKMKRIKLGIPLLIVIAIGFAAYQIAMDFASQKVVKEISSQIPTSEIKGLLKDPMIQKLIEDEVGTEKQQEILKKYAVDYAKSNTNTNTTVDTNKNTNTNTNTSNNAQNPNSANQNTKQTTGSNQPSKPPVVQKPDSNLVFKTRQEVLKFLLSKFTMDELRGFASKASGGITAEEAAEVKQKVLSRITPAEYQALKVFAIIEISKENQ